MQRLGHLLGGGAGGPTVGHRQGDRNAVGRIKQVAGRAAQLLVQVEGKGAVIRGQFVRSAALTLGLASRGLSDWARAC